MNQRMPSPRLLSLQPERHFLRFISPGAPFEVKKRKPRQACSGRHLVLFLIDAEEILPES